MTNSTGCHALPCSRCGRRAARADFRWRVGQGARLAPDGSSLAFLSDRAKAEVFQLYLLADGQLGEARPAPAVPGTVEYLAWSPDGTRILLGVAGLGAEMADAQGSGTVGSGESGLPSWYPEVEAGTPEDAWRGLWLYTPASASSPGSRRTG